MAGWTSEDFCSLFVKFKISKGLFFKTCCMQCVLNSKIQRNMSSEEFKNYARLRNGVETVPSIIRKNYHLEKLPRGKQRGRFFFGSKIAALNFRKLFNYVKGLGNYAQNPVLA